MITCTKCRWPFHQTAHQVAQCDRVCKACRAKIQRSWASLVTPYEVQTLTIRAREVAETIGIPEHQMMRRLHCNIRVNDLRILTRDQYLALIDWLDRGAPNRDRLVKKVSRGGAFKYKQIAPSVKRPTKKRRRIVRKKIEPVSRKRAQKQKMLKRLSRLSDRPN